MGSEPAKLDVVRVFISSTFLDMEAERQTLASAVFPTLRSICDQRGVALREIDLRWGITQEDADDGRLLLICLDEAKKCDVFVGILGRRYGTVIDPIPSELLQDQQWMDDRRNCSVTELEIRHAVLDNPSPPRHVYFYFLGYGSPSSTSWSDVTGDQRQSALKERIQLKYEPRLCRTLVEFRDLVFRDISASVDQLIPEQLQRGPTECETRSQQAFADARRRSVVRRRYYIARLDAHINHRSLPLMVAGEGGMGKTALLADWATTVGSGHVGRATTLRALLRRWSTEPRVTRVITYFVGSTPASNSVNFMLQWLLAQLETASGIRSQGTETESALAVMFRRALHAAGQRSRIVMILDGLDRLEPPAAQELGWLPDNTVGVSLVVSARPGRVIAAARSRNWPLLELQPLSRGERDRAISLYLHEYAHKLDRKRLGRIKRCPQTGNPLFLRLILEELRVLGNHQDLDCQMGEYLGAQDSSDLLSRIVRRLGQDTDPEQAKLSRDTLVLTSLSRNGLQESELRILLGSQDCCLAPLRWWFVRHALGNLLLECGAMLRPGYEELVAAVLSVHAQDDLTLHHARMRLAEHFAMRIPSRRAFEEYPHLLIQMQDYDQLGRVLKNVALVDQGWRHDRFTLCQYWTAFAAHNETPPRVLYAEIIDNPEMSPLTAWSVGSLLRHLGDGTAALTLFHGLQLHYENLGQHDNARACIVQCAEVHRRSGSIDFAVASWEAEVQRLREVHAGPHTLQIALGNLASGLAERGEPDNLRRAMALHLEEESLCRKLNDAEALAVCRYNQGRLLGLLGDRRVAQRYFGDYERHCRSTDDMMGLCTVLGALAVAARETGDYANARRHHQEEWSLAEKTGDLDAMRRHWRNYGCLLLEEHDFYGSLCSLDRHDASLRRHPSVAAEAASLVVRARLYFDLADHSKAAELARRTKLLANEHGLHHISREATRILDAVADTEDNG